MSDLRDVMVLLDQYSILAGRPVEDYYDDVVVVDSFGIADYAGMRLQTKSFQLYEQSYKSLITRMVDEFDDEHTLILIHVSFDYDVSNKEYHLSGQYVTRPGQIIYNMFHPRSDRTIDFMYDCDYAFMGHGVLPTYNCHQPLHYQHYIGKFTSVIDARSDIESWLELEELTSDDILHIGNVQSKMIDNETFVISFVVAFGDVNERRNINGDPHRMTDEYKDVMRYIDSRAKSSGMIFNHRLSDGGMSGNVLKLNDMRLTFGEFYYDGEALDDITMQVVEGFRDEYMMAFMKVSVIPSTDGSYNINGYALDRESQCKYLMFGAENPRYGIDGRLDMKYSYGGDGDDLISEIDGYKIHYTKFKVSKSSIGNIIEAIIDDNELLTYNSDYRLVIADVDISFDYCGNIVVTGLIGVVSEFPVINSIDAVLDFLPTALGVEVIPFDDLPPISDVTIKRSPKSSSVAAIGDWIDSEYGDSDNGIILGDTFTVDGAGSITFRVMLDEVGYSETYGKAFDENDIINGIGIDIRDRMGRVFSVIVEEFHDMQPDIPLEAFERLAHIAIMRIYEGKYDE